MAGFCSDGDEPLHAAKGRERPENLAIRPMLDAVTPFVRTGSFILPELSDEAKYSEQGQGSRQSSYCATGCHIQPFRGQLPIRETYAEYVFIAVSNSHYKTLSELVPSPSLYLRLSL